MIFAANFGESRDSFKNTSSDNLRCKMTAKVETLCHRGHFSSKTNSSHGFFEKAEEGCIHCRSGCN